MVGEEYSIDLELVRTNKLYKFYVNGILKYVVDKDDRTPLFSFKCHPYFGGNETAPHDITIRLKNIT